MRNLIILAKWLAARAQVDVVECNGSTAWIELVNGRRVINIPSSWNYSNDPDAQALLEGIMDHEALGHGRFTDLEAKAKAQDQKLIEFNALSSAIWNTLEDVFIERRSIETYPGVKHNLARTMAILSGRGFFGNADQFAACASKIHLLRAGLLNCLRHALVPGQAEVFQRNVDALGPLLQKELGSLWNDVMAVAARVVDSTCTMDNIKLTIEIMGLLEEASQEPNDSGADDQDQQQGGNSQPEPEQGDGEGDSTPGDGAPGSSCPGESQSSGEGSEGSNDASSEPQAGGSSAAGGSADQLGESKSRTQAAKEILRDQNAKLPTVEVTDGLSDAIAGRGLYPARGVRSLHVVEQVKKVSPESMRVCSQVKSAADDLQEALIALTHSSKSINLAGKRLESRVLSRVRMGNARVFRRKSEGESLSTAVLILVDCSSSMDEPLRDGVTRIDASIGLAYGLGDVLDEHDVPFQVTCYSDCYADMKVFDQPWVQVRRGQTMPSICGSTCTGLAMQKALGELVVRHEERKLVLVVTDGATSDQVILKSCYSEAMHHGIEVASIMIGPRIPSIEDLAREFGFDATSANTSAGLGKYAVQQVLAAI